MEFHTEPFEGSLTKYICEMLAADPATKQCLTGTDLQDYHAELER
jgi:hypothetical protein